MHAITSYHFPDPFTCLTGTESAMYWLKHYQTNTPVDAVSRIVSCLVIYLNANICSFLFYK